MIIDIAVAVLLAFLAVRGLIRGFSGEVVGFIGFFVSLFCAWNFAPEGAGFLRGFFPALEPTLAALACGILIFIVVSLAFVLLDKLLSTVVKAARLSLLDHVLGAAVGAAKTACLILVVYGLLTAFSPLLPAGWRDGSYAMRGAAEVWPFVSRFLQEHRLLDLDALTGAAREMTAR